MYALAYIEPSLHNKYNVSTSLYIDRERITRCDVQFLRTFLVYLDLVFAKEKKRKKCFPCALGEVCDYVKAT